MSVFAFVGMLALIAAAFVIGGAIESLWFHLANRRRFRRRSP